jgi:hypothetical protein
MKRNKLFDNSEIDMALRREIMSYIGTGAIGGIIGYYVGVKKLLGIQSAPRSVESVPEESTSPTPEAITDPPETPTEEPREPTDTPTETTGGGDSDAVAYYTFQGEGTELVDRTDSNHSGQLNNAERVSGFENQGLLFNREENMYASLGAPGELVPGSDSFTISVYFQTTNTRGRGNQNKQRLFAIRGSSNERVVITLKGDEPRVTASISEGGYDPDGVSAPSSEMHTDGEWHHVILQRDMDERQLRLYVDGEIVDQTDVTQVEIAPDAPVFLGAQPRYPNPRYYTGKIDEVGIYDEVVAPNMIP